ncbi:hypothetical protein ACQZ46_23695 [Agrobacterium salinitolerans]
MSKNDEPIFYLADGTPVYATDGPAAPAVARRFGDAPKTSAPADAPIVRPSSPLVPFAPDPEPASGGNPKLAVDYSKDPYSTTVPGQPGYDQSKDPFHQTPEQKAQATENKAKAEKEKALYERHGLGEWWLKSRGEKTGGSGLESVHSDASEARRLQRQLDDERKWAESLYPGAGGRQHSTGGTNLGEPAWSGSGEGAAHFGTLEWECRSGTIVGENGVELVAVLEQWNIYDGQ